MGKTGQSSVEVMLLFGLALTAMLVAVALSFVWPSVILASESQRSDNYWSGARPFSVQSHGMFPNQMVIELVNTEPVTLTVKVISLDWTNLNFSNHSVPFSWDLASSRCSGGSCTMAVLPGQTQIISTANFTSSPSNPCLGDGEFAEGRQYRMELAITYHGSDSSNLSVQNGSVKLVGSCKNR